MLEFRCHMTYGNNYANRQGRKMKIRDLLEGRLDVPTKTPAQLAKKHGVSVATIEAALKQGIKVEHESRLSMNTQATMQRHERLLLTILVKIQNTTAS